MSDDHAPPADDTPEEPIVREDLDVDVLFVGAGAASLAGAIRLAQLVKDNPDAFPEPPAIAVIEKGSEVGAHILSGAVMKGMALDELLPGWQDEAPVGHVVDDEDVVALINDKIGLPLPIIPPPMQNHGNYICSASRMARWLAGKAESMGVDIFCGFPAVDVLWDGDRVIGVQTGDKGVAANGKRKANFEAGINLKAKITIFGEGVLGHCTRLVTRKLGLDAGCNPLQFETGVKEVIRVPKGTARAGYVMHTLGWPLDIDTLGGTWVYGMDDEHYSVGMVVSLDYHDPSTDPQYLLQKFKNHPKVAELLRGGEIVEYGAKALSAGGWYAMPQIWFDGGMLIGESAQMMDIASLKGLHMAHKSGMLAAETAFDALKANDWSADFLNAYRERVDNSWIKPQMWAARNFHQSFDKGLFLGMARTGIGMFLGTVGRKSGHHDHKMLAPIGVTNDGTLGLTDRPKIEIATWKQKLDDLYLSGTLHEEDQPSHLRVLDPDICRTRCTEEFGNPCTRFCPAQVYEMVPDEEEGGNKLMVNFSNCVHCKTCDIKDPYQIITWTPPEGGGGPNYKMC
jgi:electron-transferring-flavoprotein dehydrogenase